MKKLHIGKVTVSLNVLLCVILCAVLLAGTTFAWFTKTLTNKDNLIRVGYFGIDLLDQTEDGVLFSDIQWVPGMEPHVEYLTVKNTGNYALRYQVEVTGKGENDDHTAAEFLECAIVRADVMKSLTSPTWEQIQAVALNRTVNGNKTYNLSATKAVDIDDANTVTVAPGKTDEFAVVMRLSDQATLAASGKKAYISVAVRAGQASYEYGDLGKNYDKDAPFVYPENLLYNGEFELNEPAKKLNWSYKNVSDAAIADAYYDADTENTYLRLNRKPGGKAPYAAQTVTDVISGETYGISGRVRDVLGANATDKATAQLVIAAKDSKGKTIETVLKLTFSGEDQPEANTWVKFNETFTVPAGTAKLTIQLKNTLGTGEVHFDDLILYEAE